MRREPRIDGRRRMRGGIVQDHGQVAARIATDQHAKGEKLNGLVARMTRADDLARGRIERRVQTGQPIAAVSMGAALRQAGPHRQEGLRAAQRLNLRFLIDAEHDRNSWAVQVQPDHVVNLQLGIGVRGEFERLRAMRLQRMRPPNAMHGAQTPTFSAKSRVLQWVRRARFAITLLAETMWPQY